MNLQFSALSQNESFARVTVAAFIAQLDPTMDELTEIKTVVSEAVTNSIIHGYENDPNGIVYIQVTIEENMVDISIKDIGHRNCRCGRSSTAIIYNETRIRTFWYGIHYHGKFYG